MALKVLPTTKQFNLSLTDKQLGVSPEAPTLVTIRQASQGAHEMRMAQLSDIEKVFSVDDPALGTQVRQRISFVGIRKIEIFTTLVDCNILDENDKPLFSFRNGSLTDMASFEKSWAKLPVVAASEIYRYVIEMNPQWSEEGNE